MYVLRLFVAGATSRSREAVLRVQQLCATELAGGCKLEVIDIYQQPQMAHDNQIVATPTLLKEFPRPERRFIGNLANLAGLFGELDLGAKGKVAI
jgi:circadian clock protein KaiB